MVVGVGPMSSVGLYSCEADMGHLCLSLLVIPRDTITGFIIISTLYRGTSSLYIIMIICV